MSSDKWLTVTTAGASRQPQTVNQVSVRSTTYDGMTVWGKHVNSAFCACREGAGMTGAGSFCTEEWRTRASMPAVCQAFSCRILLHPSNMYTCLYFGVCEALLDKGRWVNGNAAHGIGAAGFKHFFFWISWGRASRAGARIEAIIQVFKRRFDEVQVVQVQVQVQAMKKGAPVLVLRHPSLLHHCGSPSSSIHKLLCPVPGPPPPQHHHHHHQHHHHHDAFLNTYLQTPASIASSVPSTCYLAGLPWSCCLLLLHL